MHLINFQARYAPAVLDGSKPHTIRARRSDGRNPQPGDTLRLYTGLRTKQVRLLRQEVCEYVVEVTILPPMADRIPQVFLGDRLLTADQVNELARGDGFEDWRDFVAFFQDLYGLPFTGNLIGWSAMPTYIRLQ